MTTKESQRCSYAQHLFDWTKASGISDHCHLKWQSVGLAVFKKSAKPIHLGEDEMSKQD